MNMMHINDFSRIKESQDGRYNCWHVQWLVVTDSRSRHHEVGWPAPFRTQKITGHFSKMSATVLKWRRQMMTNKLQIIINWCLHRIGRPNWYNTITNVEPMETPH